MAKQYNRAWVSTATIGTGTLTLGAARTGYFTFDEAGVSNGDVVSYCIEDGDDFEIGIGTYTSSGTTLSRTAVNASKISGVVSTNKINLSGNANVSITARREDFLSISESQTAKFVFAAPNAAGGAPTFRQLIASDIPTLAPLASPNFTGRTIFDQNADGGLATATGNLGAFEIQSQGGGQPFFALHIPTVFAQYIGMDSAGRVARGGWSNGAAFGYFHDGFGTGAAGQAEMEAAAASGVFANPANLKWFPGMPKAWGRVAGAALVAGSYNVISVANTGGVNTPTVNLAVALNGIVVVGSGAAGSGAINYDFQPIATTAFIVRAFNAVTGPVNANDFNFVVFGDL